MTRVAITVSWTMILIRGGIDLRRSEIITFPIAVTKTTERAMTTEGSSLAVTASAEQTPKTCMVIGFSRFNGALSNFLFPGENNGSLSFVSVFIS
jgi:hypothetical protein